MTRTCLACGWVHVGVPRAVADVNVAAFNLAYDLMTPERQAMFGRRSSMQDYERCFHCGGPYTDFRDGRDGDCPNGCTLQAILVET